MKQVILKLHSYTNYLLAQSWFFVSWRILPFDFISSISIPSFFSFSAAIWLSHDDVALWWWVGLILFLLSFSVCLSINLITLIHPASVSPSVGIGPYNWSGMAYYPPFPYLYDYVFNPESSRESMILLLLSFRSFLNPSTEFPFSLNPLDPSLIPDIDQHSDPNEHKIHQ